MPNLKFPQPLDLTNQPVIGIAVENLASDPGSPGQAGRCWINTTSHLLKFWDGSAVQVVGLVTSVAAADATVTVVTTSGAVTVKVAKTLDHTYITDFDTQVRTSRLDQMAAAGADVNLGSHKIVSLTDGVADTDGATVGQVKALVNGLDWKPSVRAATTAALPANTYNNGAAGVGATLTGNANGALAAQDGVTLGINERLLVKNEATGANDGLYALTQVGTGGTPYILTRTTDDDQAAEVTPGTTVVVEEGTTNGDTLWVLTTNAPITIGTTALTFTELPTPNMLSVDSTLTKTGTVLGLAVPVLVASGGTGSTTAAGARANLGAPGKFAVTIGDGSTTLFNIDHLLNTTDITGVQLIDLGTNVALGNMPFTVVTVNRVSVSFSTAPTTNQFRVIVTA